MSPRANPTDPPSVEAQKLASPSLAIAGFIMLLTPFLFANPEIGHNRSWPWEVYSQTTDPLVKAVFLLWAVTAVWVLIASLTTAFRVRSTVTLILVAILLVQCSGSEAGLTITRFNLGELLSLIALGAGFLIARRPGTRRLGRTLAGLGAFALLLTHAVGFEDATGSGLQDTPRLEIFWQDLMRLFGGEEIEARRPHYTSDILIPTAVMFASAVCGFLAAFGLTKRVFLWIGFGLLAVGMALPMCMGIYRVATGFDPQMNRLLQPVVLALVAQAYALWLLACFALADVHRDQEAAA